jgi:hypothetical protein
MDMIDGGIETSTLFRIGKEISGGLVKANKQWELA